MNFLSKVVLIRCENYDYLEVKSAIQRGIALLGGPESFVKPNEKILLKPNWLAAEPPEKCITTHPMVFKAICEVLQSTGVNLAYGDSPGFQSPKLADQKTGFAAVAAELKIPLADFHTGQEVFFAEGVQNKKFTIANGVLESDGLVSLPKLKTHGFLKLTGCIKNQLGCVPGALKAEFHVKIPNAEHFAKMLVDLNLYLKPRLYVMDGIMAMEGNGPRGGKPKKMNILLFSTDPVALDATVCRIINVNPEYSYTIRFGKEAGLGVYDSSAIELLGDPIENFIDSTFDVERQSIKPYKPGGAIQFLKNRLVPKPSIIHSKCVKCGICNQVCPVNPKAIEWLAADQKVPPTYKYERCIRCYCCQELCPESAIVLKVPFIRRFFSKKHK